MNAQITGFPNLHVGASAPAGERDRIGSHYRMLRGLTEALKALVMRPGAQPEEAALFELIQDDLEQITALLVDAEGTALESAQ